MGPLAWLLEPLAVLTGLGLLVRAAVVRFDDGPGADERVPTRSRVAANVLGGAVLLLALSTMAEGPIAVPYDPLALFVFGVAGLGYPDYTPSAV